MAKKAKKKAAKKAPKKSVKKPVKKAVRKVIKKAAQKKAAPKRVAPKSQPGALSVRVDPALAARLEGLAGRMSRSLDQVLAQALLEFADNWEDHMQTVAALNADDDRVQVVAPTDDKPTF